MNMEFIAVAGLVIAAAVWLLKGAYGGRIRRAEKEAEAIHEAMRKNSEADRELDDPVYRKRLYDSDND